jgi:CheY-like chemotaxis protein
LVLCGEIDQEIVHGRIVANSPAGCAIQEAGGRQESQGRQQLAVVIMPAIRELVVLVADDDPDILDLVCFRLERAGCVVIPARNGAEALDIARTKQPDVAVLDWMMPELTGPEVIEAIRQDPDIAAMPVMLLTARVQESDVVKGFEAGADDYLTKPFSPQELSHRVQALAARRP